VLRRTEIHPGCIISREDSQLKSRDLMRTLDESALVIQNARIEGRFRGEEETGVTGTVTSALLLTLIIVASLLCLLGPLTAFAVMFWHWRKELREAARLRQARSTQVR
jgi:hypothetical protein